MKLAEVQMRAWQDQMTLWQATMKKFYGLAEEPSTPAKSDARFKGIDSRELLRSVAAKINAEGFTVGNVDATIIAQAPKMAPYIAAMVQNIAADLGVDESHVNVKATTTEKLGFTGRGEGIAAEAVCLLCRR